MEAWKIWVLIGGSALLIGLALRFAPGLLSWFGHLPGDIRVEGQRSTFFVPITSMIVVSVLATIVVNIVWRCGK